MLIIELEVCCNMLHVHVDVAYLELELNDLYAILLHTFAGKQILKC